MLNNLFYFLQNATALAFHNFILSCSNYTFFTNHAMKFQYWHGRLQVKEKTSCNYCKCFCPSCLIIGEPQSDNGMSEAKTATHTQEMQITTKFFLLSTSDKFLLNMPSWTSLLLTVGGTKVFTTKNVLSHIYDHDKTKMVKISQPKMC